MGQGTGDLSLVQTRSGCNRSCPSLGQGTGDLSETRSGCNRSCPSLGQGTGELRRDLVVIEVTRVRVRVLVTCLVVIEVTRDEIWL